MKHVIGWEEEEHWSKLVESVVINTQDGVLITDSKINAIPHIIYVNDAFIKMSGYSKEDLIGSQPGLFHKDNVDQEGLTKMYNAINNRTSCSVDLVNYTKSDLEYYVNVNISPVINNAGIITHWIWIHRDITENVRYVKAIEEQNQKLKSIAWMQSHKVRAPLAKIISLVELLKSDECPENHKDLLHYLSLSANDLDVIIKEITRKSEYSSDETQ